MKIGDTVRKIKGQHRLNSPGVITGMLALNDGTTLVHVKYKEFSVPILEFQHDLTLLEPPKDSPKQSIQLSLF